MKRRDFLQGGFLRGGTLPRREGGGEIRSSSGRSPAGQVPIGRLADFPVGAERRLEHLGLVIESLPEGLRARTLGIPEAYCAITAGTAGELMAGRDEPWPRSRVFSALINGPAGLDTVTEDGG